MTPTFSPGDRVRLRESVEVYGLKGNVFRGSKDEQFTVAGMFRGSVEVIRCGVAVTLPARLLERC